MNSALPCSSVSLRAVTFSSSPIASSDPSEYEEDDSLRLAPAVSSQHVQTEPNEDTTIVTSSPESPIPSEEEDVDNVLPPSSLARLQQILSENDGDLDSTDEDNAISSTVASRGSSVSARSLNDLEHPVPMDRLDLERIRRNYRESSDDDAEIDNMPLENRLEPVSNLDSINRLAETLRQRLPSDTDSDSSDDSTDDDSVEAHNSNSMNSINSQNNAPPPPSSNDDNLSTTSIECCVCLENLDLPTTILPPNINNAGRARGAVKKEIALALTCPRELCTTTCGHMYHKYCIEKWFLEQGRRTCPSCRKVVGRKLIKLFPTIGAPPPAQGGVAVATASVDASSTPGPSTSNAAATPPPPAAEDGENVAVTAPASPEEDHSAVLHATLISDYNQLREQHFEALDTLAIRNVELASLQDLYDKLKRDFAELSDAVENSGPPEAKRRRME